MKIMLKKELQCRKLKKSRVRLWKLKDIVVTAAFKENVDFKCNGSEYWLELKTNSLDVAGVVCG